MKIKAENMAENKEQVGNDHPNSSHVLEDYWHEYNSIKKTETVQELFEHEDICKLDDIELEIDWLIDTGFDFLVPYIQDGQGDSVSNDFQDVISTLTTKQAAAVKKRINTFKGTVHEKCNKYPPDVRDVFSKDDDGTCVTEEVGFHCRTERDNRTEITITTNGNFSGQENEISSGQSHNDHGSKSSIMNKDKESLSGAKYIDGTSFIRENQHIKSIPDVKEKRSSLSDLISIVPSSKQEYTLKSNSPPIADYSAKKTYLTERFTYNSEFHPSNIVSTVVQPLFPAELNKSNESIRFYGTYEENLPVLIHEDDEVGITQVNDLWSKDLVKVKQLSLIELTALFDSLNITYARRKALRNKNKNSVFGSTLSAIMALEKKNNSCSKVPWLLKMLVSQILNYGLEEKGILRVPGSFAKVEMLKNKIDELYFSSPEIIEKAILSSSARDCAALLKHFLRELCEPLLTNSHLDAFLQVQHIHDVVLQVKVLNLLVLMLPDFHRDVLEYVVLFLGKIISMKDINGMNLHNVSMIMAPNLFFPKIKKSLPIDEKHSSNKLDNEMTFARVTCQVTKLLINYSDVLWTIPSFLLKQVRLQNEAIFAKRFNKDHKQKKKKSMDFSDVSKNNYLDEKPVTLIKVSTSIPKVGIFCPLTDTLTASDVVMNVIQEIQANTSLIKSKCAKSKPKNSSQNPDSDCMCNLINTDKSLFMNNHCLCEVGGNLEQRRLRDDAKVKSVLNVNPLAEWVVKCFHSSES